MLVFLFFEVLVSFNRSQLGLDQIELFLFFVKVELILFYEGLSFALQFLFVEASLLANMLLLIRYYLLLLVFHDLVVNNLLLNFGLSFFSQDYCMRVAGRCFAETSSDLPQLFVEFGNLASLFCCVRQSLADVPVVFLFHLLHKLILLFRLGKLCLAFASFVFGLLIDQVLRLFNIKFVYPARFFTLRILYSRLFFKLQKLTYEFILIGEQFAGGLIKLKFDLCVEFVVEIIDGELHLLIGYT